MLRRMSQVLCRFRDFDCHVHMIKQDGIHSIYDARIQQLA